MAMNAADRQELDFRLSVVFKPGTPINREDLFAGRKSQIRDVLDAIVQNGQHVILYGERGVGKTSLANMIFPNLRAPNRPVIAPLVNCTSMDDYAQIWRAVFTEIRGIVEKAGQKVLPVGVKRKINLVAEGLNTLPPDEVRRLLQEVGDESILVPILDEFDTIADVDVRRGIADTIKYLSDRNVPATVVIIGVADDVDGLIHDHHSIERCVAQVKMPRMSRDELELIVTNSLKVVGMKIDRDALHEISRISKGLPHYTHLLGLQAGRQAVDSGSKNITQQHVAQAVKAAIDKAQHTIQSAYHKATISSRKDALYKEVLAACAMADTDDLGYFAPLDVRGPLTRIMKRDYRIEAFARHLHTFCAADSGCILRKMETKSRSRFRFSNPLIQPFVLMKALADRLITDDDLRATRDLDDPQGRLF